MNAGLRRASSAATYPNNAAGFESLTEWLFDIRFRCTPTRSAPKAAMTASVTSSNSRARFSIDPP